MNSIAPKFSATYQLKMSDLDYQKMMTDVLKGVESQPDTFSQAGEKRYFISLPDEMALTSKEAVTIDINSKASVGPICVVNLVTNQNGHEKTEDLALFNKIKSLCTEQFPDLEKMFQTIIDTMDMSNVDDQEIVIDSYNILPSENNPPEYLHSLNPDDISLETLRDVNGQRNQRTHLHQALRDGKYKLVKALLAHPEIDATMTNDRGFGTKTYFKQYTGPHKEEIKELLKAKGVKLRFYH